MLLRAVKSATGAMGKLVVRIVRTDPVSARLGTLGGRWSERGLAWGKAREAEKESAGGVGLHITLLCLHRRSTSRAGRHELNEKCTMHKEGGERTVQHHELSPVDNVNKILRLSRGYATD